MGNEYACTEWKIWKKKRKNCHGPMNLHNKSIEFITFLRFLFTFLFLISATASVL